MVNIVNVALAIAQFDQGLDAGNDIFAAQNAGCIRRIEIEAHVHLNATNGRQIIALAVEEQRVKEGACRFNGWWLAWAHDPIDIHQRAFAVHVLINRHSVADIGANIDVIDVENWDVGDARIHQILQRAARDIAILVGFPCQLVPSFDINRASFFVDDILRNKAAHDVIERHQQLGDFTLVNQLLHSARGDLLACLSDDFTRGCINKIKCRTGAAHALGEELGCPTFVLNRAEHHSVIIGIHDAFLIQTKRIKQRGHWQFAAAVNARKYDVLGVKLEIQPRAAIRDDAASKQKLARRMGFAFVMVEEHTRGTVHLADDHALGAVHDERAVWRHQRHIAHEHILLFDVFDGFCARILVNIKYDQTQGHLERRSISQIAALAFLDIKLRGFQFVFNEFQNRSFVEIFDRENRLENTLDAFTIQRRVLVA